MSQRPDLQSDYVRIRRATLSWMGLFVKDLRNPERGFPSRQWMEMGYGLEDMEGDRWLEMIHPEDRETARSLRDETFNHEDFRGHKVYRVRDRDGAWHWLMSSGVVEEVDEDGSPLRYVGLDIDVTDTHRLQAELQSAQQLAEQRAIEAEALRTAGAVIAASLDKGEAIRRVVDELSTLMPVSMALVFEEQGRELSLAVDPIAIPPDADTDRSLERAQELFHSEFGREILVQVMRNRTPELFRSPTDAAHFWMVIPLVARGEVLGAYAVSRTDATPFEGREIRLAMAIADYMSLAFFNARLYARVRELAETDQLSGLLTRGEFFARVERMVAGLDAGAPEMSCILMDIDHFKLVNDRFGHQLGDEVIRRVAGVLRRTLRGQDLVGRYGGEEFCAVLPGTSIATARGIAERIRGSVSQIELERLPDPVTISLGVAAMRPQETVDQLVGRADTALYAAKHGGRNRVELAP